MRTLAGIAAAGVLVVVPAAAAGPTGVCTVTPDPVSISVGTQYTIAATGGDPFVDYEIIVRQRGDGCTDECRDALVTADEQGNVSWTFTAYPWVDGDGARGLLVGDAKVSVVKYRTGGGPGGGASTLAKCGFTATA